ncbi:E2/E3 hybrid ubiquitin-protein ligase UBE2O-like [Notothenia coriiceps]|uniref:E2/E3 hybrid ubiquitin-protein ligase UBE2O-like n=1 Tax=Notothenia coriiceps TaxID=8208 RepID=A0A6I9NPI2_9TELE|nr:PREDICTED: E2/E3 hybrid ubiquitin-protein ligase UBE2O-like [Notothenia coriiceps]
MDQRRVEHGRNTGPLSLYGEFTLTANRKVRCAVSLTEKDLIVQRHSSAPVGRNKVVLSLKDCIGCRAYLGDDTADPAAYLTIFFYPLKRRWMSSGVSRQRAEQCFRLTGLQDPRANLEEAEKWARAVRERSARQQYLRDGVMMSALSRPSRMMLLVNPQSGKGQALTLYNNHIQRMLNEAGVTHTLVITAAAGAASGGGQMKDDCTAVGDLFSALIKGPTRTPYEDGLFVFDIQLPNIYPSVPPLFRYLSQCSGRLNPNLYDNGKVCVSLLGTWIGKGTERWTSKSSLLQVLISIQGLILVNEPYYNEAGFDSDRGLQEGYENSRCYNEMALIKMVQTMTQLLQHPVEVFKQEIQEHFASNGWRLVYRLEAWLELHEGAERGQAAHMASRAHRPSSVEPLDEQGPVAVAHSSPSKPGEEGVAGKGVTSIIEEELEDSGLSPSTGAASQQELSQNSDCDSQQGVSSAGVETRTGSVVRGPASEPAPAGAGGTGSVGSQPVVRPKKRRKSYRSFLPEGGGYPDLGFPLFPLSKGFVKSVRGVLLQYRAALVAAAVPQHTEDNDSSDECDG